MIQNKNYTILSETGELVLGHIFETAYLTIKETNETIALGAFHGDPNCGLISRANDWCIVCGSTLIVWTKDEIFSIQDDDLHSVFDSRQTGEHTAALLIDPWADNAAIWEFDIITKEKRKIKDFFDYRDKEYTGTVVW